eukprot:2040077-Rhodomonas_salina.1
MTEVISFDGPSLALSRVLGCHDPFDTAPIGGLVCTNVTLSIPPPLGDDSASHGVNTTSLTTTAALYVLIETSASFDTTSHLVDLRAAASNTTIVVREASAKYNGLGVGGALMTVVGSGLGKAGYSVRGRVGDSACEGSFWKSETSVVCMATGGVSGTFRLGMTIGLRAGSLSEGASYDRACATGVAAGNRDYSGSAPVTVMGSGLGGSEAYSGAGRRMGTACEGSGWASETSVMCFGSGGFPGSAK